MPNDSVVPVPPVLMSAISVYEFVHDECAVTPVPENRGAEIAPIDSLRPTAGVIDGVV